MNHSETPHSRYLRVLGFSDKEEMVRNAIHQILEAIEKHSGTKPPIAVSSAAKDFMISPVPVFDDSVREGTIEFDLVRQEFIIRLNKRRQQLSGKVSQAEQSGRASPADLQLNYRGRFTYAHEFAHRFFFVQADEGWVRAIELTAQETPRELRPQVLKTLHKLEEELCNRIAGDVLVPKAELVSVFRDRLDAEQYKRLAEFFQLVRRASSLFRVSHECILVRLERAIRQGHLEYPKNLCVLLVRVSDRKVGGRSRWDFRVRESIIPVEISGVKIERVFPGIAVQNLGAEFRSFAESFLNLGSQREIHAVEIPLMLRERGSTGNVKVRLKGWSVALPTAHDGQYEEKGFLLWGALDGIEDKQLHT